jgi:uncharacterized protein YbaR (Trm112 family)
MLKKTDEKKILWLISYFDSQNISYSLYGAGKYTTQFMELVRLGHTKHPEFIFDDSPTVENILGVPVYKTEDVSIASVDRIILGSDVYQKEMRNKLGQIFRKDLRAVTIDLTCLPDLTSKQPNLLQLPIYQRTTIDKFMRHIDQNTSAILEIGSDPNCDVMEFIASIFDGVVSGVNPVPYFAVSHKKLSQNIFPVQADGKTLPFVDDSFDAILSIATLEHVLDLNSFLKETYRVLRPGGFFFTFFGPIWSCAVGHHVHARLDGKEAKFWKPGRNPIPDFAHLLMTREELREYLLEGPCDNKLIEKMLEWIYESDSINRFFLDDYREILGKQDFEIDLFECTERKLSPPPPPEIKQQLAGKYGEDKDFLTAKIELLLRKPKSETKKLKQRKKKEENFYKKLRCPITFKPLKYDKENNRLICKEANLAFPIKNDIPILLPDKAIKIG